MTATMPPSPTVDSATGLQHLLDELAGLERLSGWPDHDARPRRRSPEWGDALAAALAASRVRLVDVPMPPGLHADPDSPLPEAVFIALQGLTLRYLEDISYGCMCRLDHTGSDGDATAVTDVVLALAYDVLGCPCPIGLVYLDHRHPGVSTATSIDPDPEHHLLLHLAAGAGINAQLQELCRALRPHLPGGIESAR